MVDRSQLDMRPGDTVRVWQKVKEKDKTRLQAFEGLVIARKHGKTPGATFTVRKIAAGVGVERIYPLHSPVIDKIDIVKRASKVRRAKLYYIREKAAKESRRKMKQVLLERAVSKAPPKLEEIAKEETPKEEKEVGKKEKKN